ncbi:hypothetical protein ATEIFO6365_0005065400 [Aspergillus terreus]|uniref:Uncharacterized protein n=1 Tax=Aspergillus terreus TaxID=33178 RepID=A0A5M3Z674_ASPTE|nr:hypothetical protein ATETN484_0008001400 [Aspergillus terreus]GFF16464.1 hypothetical protein ATEIFO6365_0005065400 [Aspergillus terreus]
MPRPPTKRNRMASKAKSTSKEPTRENAPKSPESQERLPASVPRVEIPQRQPKDQTPMSKSHEQAINSSPMGERGGTGSRPATRSRGYSSTLSLAGRKGDMSSKIPGTPAFENSVLSNFRRRPRQPSILQVMQAEDRSSDLDDDDFLGGLSPEDESTPLNMSRGKSLLVQNESPATPSQAPEPSSDSSRKRKRSSANIEIQVPQSPLALVGNTPVGTPTPEVENEVQETGSTVDMPPPPLPPPRSPDVLSQTMAPPMSSPWGTPHSTGIHDLWNHQRKPVTSECGDAGAQASNKPAVSTATLQDRLLPRRRQRPRRRRNVNTFDVPNDSSESDEASAESDQDELSYITTLKSSRSRRNRTTKSKPSHAGQKKQTKQKATSKKTYSARNAGNDKENEPAEGSSPLSSALDTDALESDSTSPPDRYLSEELRLQAQKFAEVDQWQMEFEDVPESQDSTYR